MAGQGVKDKWAMPLSGTTVWRGRPPTNPRAAEAFTHMVFDHSRQMRVVPDSDPKVQVEATDRSRAAYSPMNRWNGGKPFALDAQLGGAADDPGVRFMPNKSQTSPNVQMRGGRRGKWGTGKASE